MTGGKPKFKNYYFDLMEWKCSGHAPFEIEKSGGKNRGRDLGVSNMLVVFEALGMGENAQGEKMEQEGENLRIITWRIGPLREELWER